MPRLTPEQKPSGPRNPAKEKARRNRAKRARKREAHAIKRYLFEQLGEECSQCGSDECLTFDHPNGCGFDRYKVNHLARMRLYLADFKVGNLRVLCNDCNAYDGGYRAHATQLQTKEVDLEKPPF